MQPDPIRRASSVEAPDFIPDDLLAELLDEARAQVEATWPERDEPTTAVPAQERAAETAPSRGPLAGWSARDRALAVFAAKLALVGWVALVVLWTWLATQMGGETWLRIAAGGWLTLLPGALAVAHLSGRRVVWSRRRTARKAQKAHAKAV